MMNHIIYLYYFSLGLNLTVATCAKYRFIKNCFYNMRVEAKGVGNIMLLEKY